MITLVEKKYDKFGFASYKIIKDNIEWFVPNDEANTDYQEIQKWIADGGTVIDNPPE
tara:strand:+ start:359 stop:529 length:171 start_codon:yes stop_codon:yes gene_type:complete